MPIEGIISLLPKLSVGYCGVVYEVMPLRRKKVISKNREQIYGYYRRLSQGNAAALHILSRQYIVGPFVEGLDGRTAR